MTTYQENAKTYTESCGLTSDFFCRFDPNQEHVMEFQQTSGGVRPCCVPKFDKDKEHARRVAQLHQLQQIMNRINTFRTLAKKIPKSLTNDAKFMEHVAQLAQISNEIEQSIHKCKRPIFSENFNTLIQLPSQVCEPLDDIIRNIQNSFYPKMYDIEKRLAQANVEGNENQTWSGYILSALGSLVNSLRSAFSYLLAQNTHVIKQFRSAAPNRYQKLTQMWCRISEIEVESKQNGKVSNIEEKLQIHFNLILTDLFIIIPAMIVDGDKKSNSAIAIRNKIRRFCNPVDRKLLDFLKTTIKSLVERTKDVTLQQNVEKSMRNIDTTMCNNLSLRQSDSISAYMSGFILWMIVMVALDMYITCRQQDGLSQTCTSKEKAGIFEDENKDDENPQKVANKDVEQQKEERVQRNEKNRFDMQDIPDITKSVTITNINSSVSYGIFNESLTIDKSSQTLATSLLPEFIDALFGFFWFIVDHELLPTNDLEQSIESFTSKNNDPWSDDSKSKAVLHDVPDYVRFAYCLAQSNTAEQCESLVKSGAPIEALANGEERYHAYIVRARLEAEAEQREMEQAMVPSAEEIQSQVQKAMRANMKQYNEKEHRRFV